MAAATTASTAAETVQAFVERINAHDIEGLLSLMTDDHVLVDALGARAQGRDVLASGWRGYFGLFPDYAIEIEQTFEAGQSVALFGAASGTSAAGKDAWKLPAAWLAQVRASRVAEWRVFCDTKTVFELLAGSGAAESR